MLYVIQNRLLTVSLISRISRRIPHYPKPKTQQYAGMLLKHAVKDTLFMALLIFWLNKQHKIGKVVQK